MDKFERSMGQEMGQTMSSSPQSRTAKMTHEDKCPPEIHEQLKDIFRRALQAESPEECKRLRREGLNMMMNAPKECFWRGYAPHYEEDLLYVDASLDAWDYIERKIYGDIRGSGTAEEKAYDPDKGDASPLTLWNINCKGAYEDNRQERRDLIQETRLEAGEMAQADDEPSRLEKVRQEFELDPTGALKTNFVRQTPPPPITVQSVLLRIYDYASCGEKWTLKRLAEEFNVSPGVMNGAWSRTIRPLLAQMGDRLC
ncbi:MAG: Neugrin [Phormidium sp. OSCR]|nr:MAG: Neugrin [Phormidium sp. OSCR]